MKEIKLFDYQEDMKERIEKALRLHRSVMAQMPTGTGKTVLLASVVESFLREHSNCNVWIVAHRRELVSQIRETIQRVFSKTHPSSLTIQSARSSRQSQELSIRASLPHLLIGLGKGMVRLVNHNHPRFFLYLVIVLRQPLYRHSLDWNIECASRQTIWRTT